MMRYIILLLCCLFVITCERNLTGPSPFSPSPLNVVDEIQLDHSLHKIVFVDAANGWALTDSSGVYHTENGGKSWTLRPIGTVTRLMDMSFVNSTCGWICGFDMTLCRTRDGGQTWEEQFIGQPTDSVFQHIEFIDEQHGWLITAWGSVYRTVDGGSSWQLTSDDHRPGINYFRMWGARGVMAQALGPILRTSNSGESWHVLETPMEYNSTAYFVDPERGWSFSGTNLPYS
ncbi:hypothetical protein JXA02_06300 [candidate division KSB1 bacterium]|nr:hypothetical protein [candidate division KSB1 bacterium]RQW07458.1 MAG: hypothetical protein EH222_07310 [candidate division KSB1 bacterium]